jgi:hypothetical protein
MKVRILFSYSPTIAFHLNTIGEVLFYRNKKGEAIRRPADQYRVHNPKLVE